jgi:hypothetical protein
MGSGVASPGTEENQMIPLAIEAQMFALTGFALGMIGAYIGELRRRANRWKRRI